MYSFTANRAQIYYFFLINELYANYFVFLYPLFRGTAMKRALAFTAFVIYVFFPVRVSGQDIPSDSVSAVMPQSDTSAVRLSVRDSLQEIAFADSLLRIADSLRMEYDFSRAADMCGEVLDNVRDSTARLRAADEMAMAENGENMLGFVGTPEVVARKMFHRKDFFLYYPLEDRSWRPVPNPLDSAGIPCFAAATYVPEGCREIYYSAQAPDGTRNLYRTSWADSLWTVPAYVDEKLTSHGMEIYPMLSSDGNSLYFASTGLYGVGGYDIYVSSRDPETGHWGEPVNMGFPYSSPYNDFLMAPADDGRHMVFASDRGCPADSVWVYVLEQEAVPVRKAVGDTDGIRAIMELAPPQKEGKSAKEESSIPENVDTERYMEQMKVVRALRDTIYEYGRILEEKRNMFADSDDNAERDRLTADILRMEAELPAFQDSLQNASVRLRKIEMEFLFNGVIIDPDKVQSEADREMAPSVHHEYVFGRHEPGDALEMEFEVPEVLPEYLFAVNPEGGRFAPDGEIPQGIVYQIQLFTVSSRVSEKDIRGLDPVFCRRAASGRYIYSAGMFRRYNDAVSKLNTVKKLGFRTAFVTALSDGKPVDVNEARKQEKL